LVALVDRVTRRMRTARRVGRTVVLRIRFDDFTRATRSHTIPEATASSDTILRALREVLAQTLPLLRRKGVTLLGISVTSLEDADAIQLALPFDHRHLAELGAALDAVRDRFGTTAITRAVLLERGRGNEMPPLPD